MSHFSQLDGGGAEHKEHGDSHSGRHGKNDHGGKQEKKEDDSEHAMRERVIEKIIDNKQDVNKSADDVERLVQREMRDIQSEIRKHQH